MKLKLIVIILCSISILFLVTAVDYGFGVRSGRMTGSAHMSVALIAVIISIITHGIVIAFFPKKSKNKMGSEITEENSGD